MDFKNRLTGAQFIELHQIGQQLKPCTIFETFGIVLQTDTS
jgi:hypothetical protein